MGIFDDIPDDTPDETDVVNRMASLPSQSSRGPASSLGAIQTAPDHPVQDSVLHEAATQPVYGVNEGIDALYNLPGTSANITSSLARKYTEATSGLPDAAKAGLPGYGAAVLLGKLPQIRPARMASRFNEPDPWSNMANDAAEGFGLKKPFPNAAPETGAPEPTTTAGRFGRSIGQQAGASILPMAGMMEAGIMPATRAVLAQNAASAVGAGVGTEAAKEAGYGPIGQTVAGLAGGFVSPAIYNIGARAAGIPKNAVAYGRHVVEEAQNPQLAADRGTVGALRQAEIAPEEFREGLKPEMPKSGLFDDIPDEIGGNDVDPLGYYSGALEAAKSLPQARGTPEQMLSMLRRGGAKNAEIEATKLMEFLGDKKFVTRNEIIQHLEENRVGLNEVTYRGKPKDDVDELYGQLAPSYGDQTRLPNAKWSDYSLDPNNPSYRETVLHLPARAMSYEDYLPYTGMRDGAEAQRAYREYVISVEKLGGDPNFRSGHFPEPNITGHMMTSLVKDGEGKPVFLVDQIQSDWGQRLRDSGGARDEAKIADLERQHKFAMEAMDAAEKAGRDAYPNAPSWHVLATHEARNGAQNAYDLLTNYDKTLQQEARIQGELDTATAAAPGHPLVNTTSQWVTTTLRRAIQQAIEAGADKIAIPTGDTVLSYNPGDKHGMNEFYNKIVPLALKKIMRGHDVAYPEPARVDKLETPTKGPAGEGFTVFPITDAVKQSANRGQPLFARGGSLTSSPP